MNPPPREPVKHWRTVAKPAPVNLGAEHEEHESTDVADKYADAFLRENPEGEVCLYKFEHRYTAKLVIEKDGGRTAT